MKIRPNGNELQGQDFYFYNFREFLCIPSILMQWPPNIRNCKAQEAVYQNHESDMMNCSKELCYAVKHARYSISHIMMMTKDQKCAMTVQKRFSCLQRLGGCTQERNMSWNFKLPYCCMGIVSVPQKHSKCTSSQYLPRAEDDLDLSRDFLVQLWVADRKKPKSAGENRHKLLENYDHDQTFSSGQCSLQFLLERLFSGASVAAEKTYNKVNSDRKQPPTSHSATGILEPMSSEEAKVKPLLARSNLLITRDIEWANLVLGFEQENRYAVVDIFYPQSPVGFIREQSNVIARQLLRLRRPFVAYITDGLGNELFKVRRPFWWITSSIYTEINGQEVGVVHRRWHLWRRIYDLYLGNKQFAVVENPGFWNWTFTLKDIDGNVLAEIDRDWRGFGFEIFTDAGQYVIRFGSADFAAAPGIQEFSATRPLTLSERAVAVALAVSLDNDYFSRHGGWGFPFMIMDD